MYKTPKTFAEIIETFERLNFSDTQEGSLQKRRSFIYFLFPFLLIRPLDKKDTNSIVIYVY